MRLPTVFLLIGAVIAQPLAGQEPDELGPVPTQERIGTMSDLMVRILYPTSDAIFYIATRTPTTSEEWTELEGQTLMLAESANLLMMPRRARDEDQWMRDAELLLRVGEAAFKAAKDHDVAALEALNDQLYQSCVQCHLHYRRGYGRRGEQLRPNEVPRTAVLPIGLRSR